MKSNLCFGYFYRDASNYKTPGYDMVLAGPISAIEVEEIRQTLDDGQFIIPGDLDLPDSRHQFAEGGVTSYDEDDDHVYNEVTDLELTDADPTRDDLTAQDLLARFRQVRKNGGWNLLAAMERLG